MFVFFSCHSWFINWWHNLEHHQEVTVISPFTTWLGYIWWTSLQGQQANINVVYSSFLTKFHSQLCDRVQELVSGACRFTWSPGSEDINIASLAGVALPRVVFKINSLDGFGLTVASVEVADGEPSTPKSCQGCGCGGFFRGVTSTFSWDYDMSSPVLILGVERDESRDYFPSFSIVFAWSLSLESDTAYWN